MPRAPKIKYDNKTAAAQGCGCFIIPPLIVLFIGILLASFSLNNSIQKTHQNSSLAPLFTPEIQYWSEHISRWANASSLNPNLIATIMQIESCGDSLVQSSAGAMGLFQVMPFHFSPSENPYNPETNAFRGLDYLSRALKASNGDVRLAMAGYNGGISIITQPEWTWAEETKRYIYYGAPIYADAQKGLLESQTLLDWYWKYGQSMCVKAKENQLYN